MYSPKIKPELIPKLYRLGKRTGKPMTEIVDSIVREGIRRWKPPNKRKQKGVAQ